MPEIRRSAIRARPRVLVLRGLMLEHGHSLLLVEDPLSETMRFRHGIVTAITERVDLFVLTRTRVDVF